MTAGQTNTLNLAGASDGEITGVVSNGGTWTQTAAGFSSALTKTGLGTWTLSGNNSFTGRVTTSAGVLRATTSANALGTGIATLSLSGGTLQLANDTGLSFNRNTTVTGNTTVTADRLTSAATSTTHSLGTLSIGAQTLTASRGTNITGAGIGGINFGATTLTGAGTVSSSANTLLTLASVVNGGFLLTATGAGDTTVTGIMSGTGGLTKTGNGTLILAGVNTYNTGTTTVQAGTLTLSGNRTAAMAAVTVAGGVAGNTPILNIQNGNFGMGQFVVGSGGSISTVNHSAGTITSVGGAGILMGSGGTASTANYNLSGGALTVSSVIMGVNNITVGTGLNVITQSGGTFTNGTLRIGRYDAAGSAGTDNTFAQSLGTATVTNLGLGGNTADSAGTNPLAAKLNLTGGFFTATNFLSLSAGGANTSTINIGGLADVTLPAFPTNALGTGSTATLNFDGGTLRPGAASATYIGGLTNAFIKAGGAKLDVASGRDITITQDLLTDVVSTGGGLTKDGVGVLTLTGTNTYTGITLVSAGTLLVNGSLSSSSAVTVDVGTLGGTSGTMGEVTVNSGGTFAPGSSIGTLNLGSLMLGGASLFEINASTNTSDLAIVSALLSFGGTLNVTNLAGTLSSGQSFNLFDWGTTSGSFTSVTLPGLGSGLAWDQSNLYSTGVIAVIPEPSAAALLGGFGLLALLRRRRG
jgi:autotransporter-associated beta strand protein